MEKKEDNVYEETTKAEAIATASGAVAQESENASAVLGKFKDVNALARAYGALEAEFTRRSQRLKELERLADNLQGDGAAAVGAEKLRKHAKARREEARAFDDFLALVGKAHTDDLDGRGEPADTDDEGKTVEDSVAAGSTAALQTQELCLENGAKEGGVYALKEENTLAVKPDGEGNAAEYDVEPARSEAPFLKENGDVHEEGVKGEKAFPAVAEHGNTAFSSEELYRQASRNEGVRLKIIGEYLASIGKTGAPLTANGAGTPVTPPLKAKNIGDAGVMALQYFKQP
ncbi:MAG: hypothetical protein IJ308_08295 [Clostridia bacterium]|nr:hypothetical protein [Clostridia bacterium]MBQ7913718.1 hypothetical protein [Clostridia bacterium]